MGLTGRMRERTREREQSEAAHPAQAVLDRGSEVVGQLRFADAVRIEGRVEGEVEAATHVEVAEGAHVKAGIRAETVEVHGTVEGDIRVRRKVILHATARVTGEIETAGIVVEEGARFKGCIVIGGDEQPVSSAAAPKPDAATTPGTGDAPKREIAA